MTTNAFIFSWDQLGIESIIPITQYEKWEQMQLIQMLKDGTKEHNPIHRIVNMLTMRAKFNTQRHYEIYAIDCEEGMTEDAWRVMWESCPQETADLIRARGHKIYSDRANTAKIKII
jgi:hypothetical protein